MSDVGDEWWGWNRDGEMREQDSVGLWAHHSSLLNFQTALHARRINNNNKRYRCRLRGVLVITYFIRVRNLSGDTPGRSRFENSSAAQTCNNPSQHIITSEPIFPFLFRTPLNTTSESTHIGIIIVRRLISTFSDQWMYSVSADRWSKTLPFAWLSLLTIPTFHRICS